MSGPYALDSHDSAILPGSFSGATAPGNRYKEWFSWSVVASTASAAGLVCQVPTIDVNKVDVRVETWGAWQGRVRSIGLQLKATSAPSFIDSDGSEKLAFSLDGADYNALLDDCSYKRFLVVVALPPMDETWVRQLSSTVELQAGAWWAEVIGAPTEQASKTVHLPVEQRFDLDGLTEMLSLA